VVTTDYACTSLDCTGGTDAETGAWIVGVDLTTGGTRFRVPLQNSTSVWTTASGDALFCGGTSGTSRWHAWPESWAAIIAGDGRYYVAYTTQDWTVTLQRLAAQLYPEAAYALWEQLVVHVVNPQLAAARATHAAPRATSGESYTAWDAQLDGGLDGGDRTTAITLLNQRNVKYKRLCDRSRSLVLALADRREYGLTRSTAQSDGCQ